MATRERGRDERVIERVRKRSGLSCDSVMATRERGRDERVIERMWKRSRVIRRGFQSEEEAKSDF